MPFYMNSARQAEDVADLVCDVYKATKGKLPKDLVGAIRYMLQQKKKRQMVVIAFYDHLTETCPKAVKLFTDDEYEAIVSKKDVAGKFTKIHTVWKQKKEEGKDFDGVVE